MSQTLIERARAGDHDAYADLVRQRIGHLFHIARLILRDTDAAQDATQDALVAAWRDLPKLRDPARLDAWLYRLLVRACYREAGRHQRQRVIAASVRPIDPSTGDVGIGLADRDRLERGFRRLDADQRAVIVLHHYLGLELRETAAILGIPEGTAKSRLHRGTRALGAAIAAEDRPALTEGRPA